MRSVVIIALFFVNVLLLASCQQNPSPLFRQLPATQSGIHFNNHIEEDEQHNIFEYLNLYTGAGVAAGDINNDGLTDLYFSGNMVSGQLYLNKGELQFEDITAAAGVADSSWGTGVAMVDINQDGWLDIYVCTSGNTPEHARANLLYINNGTNAEGIPTFTESAARYGIADTRQSMHAAFFDYDKDEDLDLFLIINQADFAYHVNNIHPRRLNGEDPSTDVLYRNEGTGPDGHPVFTDVSGEAGILVEGYSLGLAISDINQDSWPDIYISNDFIGNDVLYINQQDGTFADQSAAYLKHTSYAGMGNDVADFNNDGLVDILVLDMRPEDNKRQKLSLPASSYNRFELALQEGYQPQYTRNTLQLNQGMGRFSEIGFLSGISSTDWSWSALLADYDNDGDRDLFVTNGFLRDLGNLDYINYQSSYPMAMGSEDAKKARKLADIASLESNALHDYLFENQGALRFADKSSDWGITRKGFSHGAVYADLDLDGDLELVVNTMNDKAHIYENRASELYKHHFLKIQLQGTPANRQGLGAKITLWHQGKQQFYEHYPYRGYESSVDPLIHFGLGNTSRIDSLSIVWPDGKTQLVKDIATNQVLSLNHEHAQKTKEKENAVPTLLQQVNQAFNIHYRHQEDHYVDFKTQPLLPHMHSREGPGLAVADINGDQQDDVYAGGAAGYPGRLFLQQSSGTFSSTPFPHDSLSEDMGVLFFDADGDGDQDLYVVSGGSSFPEGSPLYQDRLYLNDGNGHFNSAADALPRMHSSGSCVVAADYDRDGDLDLFVGGRVVPGAYPYPARSYLLRNDSRPGSCRFTDVTQETVPELSEAGLLTAALWTDYDNDGWTDLLLTGEFMPLRFFHNEQGRLKERTEQTGLQHTSGWWNSLTAGDFDQDGDTDYLAGNLGLNTPFKVSAEEPLCIYAHDYDKNGSVDPVMCYYIQGENYIAHARDMMNVQITAMRSRFQTYADYASVTFEESFLPQELSEAYVVRSERFESSYLENLGSGKFRLHSLPVEAQMAPVFGMTVGDYNQDQLPDVLLTGNAYDTEVSVGRYDASLGLLLQGDGKGNFTPVPARQSGFVVDKDAKGMVQLTSLKGSNLVWTASNNDSLLVYSQQDSSAFYRAKDTDAYAWITLASGKTYKHEFYYGSSYLSHTGRTLRYPPRTRKIVVTSYTGKSSTILP